MSKPDNIILEGVTGSTAYGLDTEASDIDIKGVFVAPTRDVLSIFPVKETFDHTEPDYTYYEIGKFISLAMKCNPSILELLFLEGYKVNTKFGRMLVDNRHHFLSKTVFHSYGGYAVSQVRKLNARGSFGNGRGNRYAKHARHCFRLLYQGRELLETGSLTVRVNKEMREELFSLGELSVHELVDKFEGAFAEFDKIDTVLPDKPNYEEINNMLLKIRKGNYA